jgi:hypothetical protein
MRKLFSISFLILSFCSILLGQNQQTSPCPKITVYVPKDVGYMGRGEQYNINVIVEGNNWEGLIYNWKLSGNIPFEGQGKPVIFFIAKEEMNGLGVKASVEIKDLPENCKNTASDSFQILFNPGTPITLEDYEKLTFSKEKKRLDNLVAQLKEYKDGIALFIIYYTEKDTKQTLKSRLIKISDYLRQKHKLSGEKFNFVFGGISGNRTKVYLAPVSMGFDNLNWEERLEKLDFPLLNKSSNKKQN